MQEDTYNQWATIIGEVILGFGSIECLTRSLVEFSSGDEGHVYQADGFEGRINRVISILKQEPECFVARKYDRERLTSALISARSLKSVRNDIAHNPLNICSGMLIIYDASATESTGDVSYSQYTLEELRGVRVQLNSPLKEIRFIMQVDGGDELAGG
jgi:hypothetical protein